MVSTLASNYKDSSMRLDLVKILGVNKPVTNVTVNKKSYQNYLYNMFDDVLILFYFFSY